MTCFSIVAWPGGSRPDSLLFFFFLCFLSMYSQLEGLYLQLNMWVLNGIRIERLFEDGLYLLGPLG